MIPGKKVREHKYRLGQLVKLSRRPFSSASGQYQIVKLLPYDGGAFNYRIKGKHEAHDRVAVEYELAPVDA